MTPADLDHIIAIEQESFTHPWSQRFFMDELTCRDAFNRVVLNQRPVSGKTGDCRNQADIVRPIDAYICFRLIAGEMHILKIAVRPERRNQGMAGWLLEQSFEIALRHQAVAAYLETRITNKAALKLYHTHGFEVIGQRPGYYADNREDALVMMKTLKEGV